MSRKLKFRAYKKSQNRMMEWDELSLLPNNRLADVFNKIYLESVMQFIGCKDQGGKDIYEGDILEFENGPADDPRARLENYVVSFDETYGMFKATHETGGYIHPVNMPNHVIVIGNVHENPQLLEGFHNG